MKDVSNNPAPLTNPVGQYRPQVLMLAPEGGDDANTKSLIAQFLELGFPIELDENWHLPTTPPKDLSAYKACIFPETAKEKYDKALDDFYLAGGYVPYQKYYPVGIGVVSRAHHFVVGFGRDVYFWTMANVMMEGGLVRDEPQFAATMEARSVDSLIAEYRQLFFSRNALHGGGPWTAWGDTGYTQFLSNTVLAERLGDVEWQHLLHECYNRAADTTDEALTTGKYSETSALPGTMYLGLVLNGSLLLKEGHRQNEPTWIDAGAKIMRAFVDQANVVDGILSSKYMRVFWSESLIPAPGLYALTQATGDKKFAAYADNIVKAVIERNQRPDGIWNHWTDSRGQRGGCWSCGTMWSLLWLVESLQAVDPASASAEMIRGGIHRTLRGLTATQHKTKGIWHLVVDEPDTRLDSRAGSGIVYCLDRLNEMGLTGSDERAMADRAFTGLKRLHYRGGLGASVRGTATGVPEYYRTRPMGFYDMNLFPGAMATRAETKRAGSARADQAAVSSGVIAASTSQPADEIRPEFRPIQDDPRLPRVLLIGDSISIQYTFPVRELLAGKANVHRVPDNCSSTRYALGELDKWIGETRWDIIHFNFGLHDLKHVDAKGNPVASDTGACMVPLEEYEANLQKIASRLRRTGAAMIWCSSTPVPEGAPWRRCGDEVPYNRAAAGVMAELGIETNDLCAFVTPRMKELQQHNDPHFTSDGARALGKVVAAAIEGKLSEMTSRKTPEPQSKGSRSR